MTDPLLAKLQHAVTTGRLWTARTRLVVAVSGGADSIALLHALQALRTRWTLSLHVAHLDHGLRAASSKDAAFVRQLAAQWHVPSTIERRDVGPLCAREGWSLEDGARRIRYQFLLETARQVSATRIALAHTADDQAETVLMRLIRGTGLLGLTAIPPARELDDGIALARPLLGVWRTEVLAYLTGQGVAYRDDASNHDDRFLRNRVRHELLPLLERRYNPNMKGCLTQLAEQSRSDYTYLQAAASRQWKRTAKERPQVAISIPVFLRQPKALQRQLVRHAIQRIRGDIGQLEFRHWLEVERLFAERPGGTRLDLPGGVRLHRNKDRVVCLPPVPRP